MERIERSPLGMRAVWHGVGYDGIPFAPCRATYPGIDAAVTLLATRADSGVQIGLRSAPGNLHPLIGAVLYEAGFAMEAGPLSTWAN